VLIELRLENYAVIDNLAVEFAPGLNLLTGETGAGKSILIDALALLLGDKASADVIRAGARNSISVSVCGEMAGEPLYTLLLLGLGLTTFSMNGPDVPEVKKIIRSTTYEHAKQVARKVMSFDSERQVMHYLREETRKIIPEAF